MHSKLFFSIKFRHIFLKQKIFFLNKIFFHRNTTPHGAFLSFHILNVLNPQAGKLLYNLYN
jgi:hypothetical protein